MIGRKQTRQATPTQAHRQTVVACARPGQRILGLVAVAALLGGLLGCGEQDLYTPPESPFAVSGRVVMPTEIDDVAILGNHAYVAAGQGGLQVVDISDPDHPVLVTWANTKKYAESVIAAQTYDSDGTPRRIAFVVDGTEGITTFDITDPANLVDFKQGTGAYDGKGTRFVPPKHMTDPYMIFLADSWRGMTVFFQIMDTPGALDFQRAGELRIFTYGYTKNLVYADGYIYIAEDQMGVTVVDATALPDGGLVLQENFDTPGEARDIQHAGGFLFVADGPYGLQILEISEDHQLSIVASLPLMGDCLALEVRDATAFIAADDAGLHVVDVRDPYHPVWLGNVASSEAVGVAVGQDNVVCVADQEEGLIVFRGPDLPGDFTRPAAVVDLTARVSPADPSTAILSWTAPGNDGDQGQADLYDLRWSFDPTTVAEWEVASEVIRRPFPEPAGTPQSLEIEDLLPGATYYFALKTRDEARNWSDISNIESVTMTLSALASGTVTPDSGDVSTLFTYSVFYTDPEGDAPVLHDVVIDGSAFEMEQADTASDYTQYVQFLYATNLDLGCHEFAFEFDDGNGLVTTPVAYGPHNPADPFAFEMKLISVGEGTEFLMGSPHTELGRKDDETQHTVTLTRDYYISDVEVTQILYRTIMGDNPSFTQCHVRPVSDLTWYDAVKFCNEFSAGKGLDPAYIISAERYEDGHLVDAILTWDADANGYRLPTEAEWEYACRAGSSFALSNGELVSELCELDPSLDAVGWYCGNSDTGMGRKAHAVGEKEPNSFGLYDMHGNVWEFCWDWYGDYSASSATDPTGPPNSVDGRRVRRGGHWDYFARECRSASRGAFFPDSRDDTTGFRFVRNAE